MCCRAQQNRAASPTKPRWLPALVSVAVVAVLLFIYAWLNPRLDQRAHADSPKIRSLAVLPLQNLSGDPTQDFLADGMTDELITELGKSTALRVISRTSVTQYKGTKKSLQQIARELNVDAILEGTVVRSANHVRITANLVQSSPEAHLLAQTYESENGDLFSLQHQVANSVVQQIQVTLRPPDASHHARSIDPKAQDLFYRGVYALESSGAGSHPTAVEYLQGAVNIDPSFADAYAALAMTYAVWMPGDAGPRDNMLKAREAALKSISLDNSLAVGHMALAYVDMNYDWNFAEAERDFRRALEANAEAYAPLVNLGGVLLNLGRPEEALQHNLNAARRRPNDALANSQLGMSYFQLGRLDSAEKYLAAAKELDPAHFSHPQLMLAEIHLRRNDRAAAVAELTDFISRHPDAPEVPEVKAAIGRLGAK